MKTDATRLTGAGQARGVTAFPRPAFRIIKFAEPRTRQAVPESMRSNQKEDESHGAEPGTEQSQGSGRARNIGGTVWYNTVGWVRQESAAATALVQAFIALGIAFEWWHWSPAQTGAVVGIVAALLGMFVRSQVTPIHRFRPRTGPPGASGRGVSNWPQGGPDSGVRVLPGTGASRGRPGRTPGWRAGRRPDRTRMAGGPPPDRTGMAGGPPPGPDAGQPPGRTLVRPVRGPPARMSGRPAGRTSRPRRISRSLATGSDRLAFASARNRIAVRPRAAARSCP